MRNNSRRRRAQRRQVALDNLEANLAQDAPGALANGERIDPDLTRRRREECVANIKAKQQRSGMLL